ncbi:substance-P receptor [Exaiptasia diaphana]|uniref:G-protein coupled receptors family 1 profile domain-containing protein n=1 Tax=Exaiptasia diaphana TaxID=2652724 RepID=A0A913XFS9_EXADI|nr:substance-P receptor [Exaiptasia diaphana]
MRVNSTLNFTHSGSKYTYFDRIPWNAVFSIQFLVAMVGNFLIVWIVYRDNRLKTTTNYLIANMAASDLIAGLFIFPAQIVFINFDYQWLIGGDVGNALCKLNIFTIEMSFNVSVYTCVAIAIDRYFAVAHPFRRIFDDRIKHVIASIWIITALIRSPHLYFTATLQVSDIWYCTIPYKDRPYFKVYKYIVLFLSSLLSAMFITITYALTICKLYNHKVPELSIPAQRRRQQKNKKVLKHGVAIVVLLYLCHGFWMTFIMLLSEGKLNHLSPKSSHSLSEASSFILYLSLVCNFFIYVIFNDIYRVNIKALLQKCCCRSQANRKQEIPVEEKMTLDKLTD